MPPANITCPDCGTKFPFNTDVPVSSCPYCGMSFQLVIRDGKRYLRRKAKEQQPPTDDFSSFFSEGHTDTPDFSQDAGFFEDERDNCGYFDEDGATDTGYFDDPINTRTSERRQTISRSFRKIALPFFSFLLLILAGIYFVPYLEGVIGKPPDISALASAVLARPTPTITPTPTPIIPQIAEAAYIPLETETHVGIVVRALDGATVVVQVDGKDHTIRYLGLQAPRPNDPAGEAAKIKNEGLVVSKRVALIQDTSKPDHAGYSLWYVISEGKFINFELLRMGAANLAEYGEYSCAEMFKELSGSQTSGGGQSTSDIPTEGLTPNQLPVPDPAADFPTVTATPEQRTKDEKKPGRNEPREENSTPTPDDGYERNW